VLFFPWLNLFSVGFGRYLLTLETYSLIEYYKVMVTCVLCLCILPYSTNKYLES